MRRPYVLVAAIAGLLVTAMIAASLIGARSGESAPAPRAPALEGNAATLLQGIPQQGPALGRPNAPVTLVEFADVQCPYCAAWSNEAFADVVRDYVRPGKARIVFSGLAFVGPDSETGLRFVLAAGRQGKLWQAVHLVYANQGAENTGWVTEDFLREIGASIPGLVVERALRESYSPEVEREIAAAKEQATQLGVRGTPSFAAGRTGGALQLAPISRLEASALRPTLDSLAR